MALLVEIGANVNGLLSGLNTAKTAMTSFAQTTQGITQNLMSGNVAGIFEQVTAAAASGTGVMLRLGIAVAGVAIGIGVVKTMNFAKEMEQIAEAAGFTVNQVFSMQRAFERQGMSLEQIAPMMAKARMEISNLKDPASRASIALKALGLGAKDFEGKSNMEMLQVLSNAEAKAKDAGKFLAATSQLFGLEKGGKMAAMLTGGNLKESEQRKNPAAQDIQDSAPVFLKINAVLSQIKDDFLAIGEIFFGRTATFWLTLLENFEKLTHGLHVVGEFLAETFLNVMSAMNLIIVTIVNMLVNGIEIAVKSAINQLVSGVLKVKDMVTGNVGSKEVGRQQKENTENSFKLNTDDAQKILDDTRKAWSVSKPSELNAAGIPKKLWEEAQGVFRNKPVSDKDAEAALPTIPTQATPHPLMPIVSDLTKMGGGGFSFGGDVTLDIQRQQLIQQTRTANAIEKWVSTLKPSSNQMIGITPDYQTA
jgi:hypothetical protein